MVHANPFAALVACFDDLASVPHAGDLAAHHEIAQSIIDTLSDYPKPRERGDHTEPPHKELAAYLYVSIARNSIKLAQIECVPYDRAIVAAYACFESAMGLLSDK